jgi:hypothetical protein
MFKHGCPGNRAAFFLRRGAGDAEDAEEDKKGI